jgi:hypothetical protein
MTTPPVPRLFSFVGGSSGAWRVEQTRPVVGESLPAAAALDVVAAGAGDAASNGAGMELGCPGRPAKFRPSQVVAVPGAFATTVAVNVTLWLWFDGLCDEVTELVVPSLFTVWVSAEEVLGLKVALPL